MEENIKGVYIGDRGEDFKNLIRTLLKRGNIKKIYIDKLLSDECMKVYSSAFTSETIDENVNYQVYEQLGDLTGNKFIVWYIYRKFPQLRCPEGVKIVARLRINYGAKNSFCKIAEKLGFWPFISATNDARQRLKKSLLEDVFEAFLGATESMLDDICLGIGYIHVYRILKSVFDELDISLKYEDLYDSKTRLKELFDFYKERLGVLTYEEEKKEQKIKVCIAKRNNEEIGRGSAALKIDAEQVAATMALKKLETLGFVKEIPSIYNNIQGEEKKKTTEKEVMDLCKGEIDRELSFKGTKKNSKYNCTVLSHYCRKKDKKGIKILLKAGADPNKEDSNGMTCFDLLCMGEKNSNVLKCIKIFQKYCKGIPNIHRNVKSSYLDLYEIGIVVAELD